MGRISFWLIIALTFFFFVSTIFLPLQAKGQSGSSLADVTIHFLNTLETDQKANVNHSFEDTARMKWTNLPVGMVPRPGLAYGSLKDSSRIAFHHLLTTFLSSRGYLKFTSIMQLDDILNSLYLDEFQKNNLTGEQLKSIQSLKWSHDNFFISIWGDPQKRSPWGLNFGGHHISLNITVSGEQVSFTPLFLGSDPAKIKKNKYAGWRVLSKEEDYGFLLLHALTDDQKKIAIIHSDVPRDIITNPKSLQRITSYTGIPVKDFSNSQKDLLEMLIQEYTHNLEHEAAHLLYDKIIRTGLEKIYFAWIGSQESGKPHYYMINGPDFLIEYDNFPASGNHIHLILREKGNDFGEDILKAHYQNSAHHKN